MMWKGGQRIRKAGFGVGSGRSSPLGGGGPCEAWWRGTRGVSCPIYVARLRPCPPTTPPVVPLPVPGGIKGRPPQTTTARPHRHTPPPLILRKPPPPPPTPHQPARRPDGAES